MKKHIYIITALYLVSSFTAQAIIFGDEDSMKEGKSKVPVGAYPLRTSTEFISTHSKDGTAVYFETEDGKYFGLTSAHALNPEGEEKVGLILGQDETVADGKISKNFYLRSLNAFQKHPSYGCDLFLMSEFPANRAVEKKKMYVEKINEKLRIVVLAPNAEPIEGMLDILVREELTPEVLNKFKSSILEQASKGGLTQSWEESVRHDIGIFSLKKKDSAQLPHKFKGALYDGVLNDGEEYDVIVSSCGPMFDNQLTSYQNYVYHEAPTRITYNAGGFFTQVIKSKEFYLSLSLKQDGTPEWLFNVLPDKSAICTAHGDSGSIVRTQDGKAIALQAGVSWDRFYKDNQELAQHLINFRKEKVTENLEATLLQKIHADIADEQKTKKLLLEGSRVLYRFTLKENFSPLTAVNYFTPLKIHNEFIETFINQHKWQTQPNLPRSNLYQNLNSSLRIFKKSNVDKLHGQAWLASYESKKIEITVENLPLLEAHLATIKNYQDVQDVIKENEEILSWWQAKKDKLKEADFQPSSQEKVIIEKLLRLPDEVKTR